MKTYEEKDSSNETERRGDPLKSNSFANKIWIQHTRASKCEGIIKRDKSKWNKPTTDKSEQLKFKK